MVSTFVQVCKISASAVPCSASDAHNDFVLICCRQGKYQYKKGTTGVLTESVKKLDFEVVSTEVKAEAMDTA